MRRHTASGVCASAMTTHDRSNTQRNLLSLFLLALAIWLMLTSQAAARAVPESFADLVEKLSPAVVNISSSQKVKSGAMLLPFGQIPGGQMDEFKDFFEQFGGQGGIQEREVQSLGSGFVIDPDGYVVTNNHVVEQAEEITVRFQDDTKYEATLVGRDSKTDLALLKIKTDRKLPFVTFGDSDSVRVGDWIVAIGNPYGLGGSVTAGIISARSRNINAGPFDDFLQTDAAINKGNSGGPLFNTKGEVIGVNTAIFSPTGGNVGIGFAVPAALAKPVLDQLKEFGRTHRGWLGVKIQEVTEEIADSIGLSDPKGALVLDVTEDSPASKAGFKPGDVILKFDGKDIEEMRHLPRIVAETAINKRVDVVIWRDESKKTLGVTLGELDESEEVADTPPAKSQMSDDDKGEEVLGMKLAAIDGELRSLFSLSKDQKGVAVLSVDRKSEAAARGILRGDVISRVNQDDVATVDDLKDALDDAEDDGKKFVLIRVMRGGEGNFVTLPLEEE